MTRGGLRTVLVLSVVLGLAACSKSSGGSADSSSSSGRTAPVGSPGPPASVPPGDAAKVIAAVDGVVITEASFNAELNALGSVPSYLDATDLVLAPGSIATRRPQGGFDPGYVRSLLRRRILLGLVEHELQARGVTVSADCTKAATDSLPAALSGDAAEGRAFLAAFPQSYRDELVVWNAEVRQLQQVLTGLPCGTADPGAQDKIGTAYATWLDATLPTASVSVDAAYGTWDSASGTIVPLRGVGTTTSSSISGSSG